MRRIHLLQCIKTLKISTKTQQQFDQILSVTRRKIGSPGICAALNKCAVVKLPMAIQIMYSCGVIFRAAKN
jgi:hypothetical protein